MATTFVPDASAAKPCWKHVVDDWYDGQIDRRYPRACYEQALRHLPSDVRIYSDAPRDIRRAMLETIRAAPIRNSPGARETRAGGSGTAERELQGEAAGTPAETDQRSIPVPLLILAGMILVLLLTGGIDAGRKRRRG